jgi:hypothetical protein
MRTLKVEKDVLVDLDIYGERPTGISYRTETVPREGDFYQMPWSGENRGKLFKVASVVWSVTELDKKGVLWWHARICLHRLGIHPLPAVAPAEGG